MRLDIDCLYNTKKTINNVLQYMNNAKKSLISIKSNNEYCDYIMKIINDIKNAEMIINENNSWIDETINKFLMANLLSENTIMNTTCDSKQSNLKPSIGVSDNRSNFANVGRYVSLYGGRWLI